jgi:hypothetical protein
MSGFFRMSEQEMILLSATTALLLIENLNADEQNTLGNFLMAVGQNISSGVGQKELREKIQEDNSVGNAASGVSQNLKTKAGNDK